ncbi:MAG: flagellar motor switch phosphatase FliY [Oscillospiraceae bacterium]
MSGDANIFSTLEIDTIGEIMNISMGSAATAASTLLDKKVVITTPVVNIVDLDSFDISVLEPAIAVEIKYIEGISGSNLLILRMEDAKTILAQMMQTELPDDYVFDEMGYSAICEMMNQMMGSSATVLSCFLGRSINISTPVTAPIDEWNSFKKQHLPQDSHLVTIQFTLSIEGVMESEFISVMEVKLAKEIIAVSLNFDTDTETPQPQPEAPIPSITQKETSPADAIPQPAPMPQALRSPRHRHPVVRQRRLCPLPKERHLSSQGDTPLSAASGLSTLYTVSGYQVPPVGYGYSPQAPAPMAAPAQDPVVVKNYDYSDFSNESNVKEVPHNLDLVMNVPVQVTVELGRTKRKIKEILEFGQGTIVELDKQAGSQVDVIVNGQLIAKGDVVVVDDNFSIRITEILKARDTLTMI